MKALVFDAALGSWDSTRGFELEDVPAPVISEKENLNDKDAVLIKMHFAGVCGSDKNIWNRQAFRDQILESLSAEKKACHARDAGTRRIIGHESFGEIVTLGSAACKKYKLKKGDFVSCESHVVCQSCFQCEQGELHVCTNEKILGISYDGCFAEYMKVPGHIVWKTDTEKIRPELGALQEPFGNAVHAASKVPLNGKTVAIFGLGPIGLFLTLVARGLGAATIIGVEPNPISQEMAKRLGIDYVIPLKPDLQSKAGSGDALQSKAFSPLYHRDEEVVKKIEELTGGLGVDVSFEMAGFNSSFNNAIFATRRGGDVIGFGIKTGDFVLEDYNRFIVRGITIHAVIGRELPKTWEITQNLFADPKNKIQENIWNIILNQGKGTILPMAKYTKDGFEQMMAKHPKFLLEI